MTYDIPYTLYRTVPCLKLLLASGAGVARNLKADVVDELHALVEIEPVVRGEGPEVKLVFREHV